MWKVDSITNDRYTCFQNLFVALSKFYGLEHIMMFSEQYHSYIKSVEKKSLFLSTTPRLFFEKLRCSGGLNTKFSCFSSKKDLILKGKEIIKSSPFIILCDEFFLQENLFYQKAHINHAILVVAVSDDGNIKYIDSFTKNGNIFQANVYDLEFTSNSIFGFIKPIKSISNSLYHDEFNKNIEYMLNNTLYESISDSLSDLRKKEKLMYYLDNVSDVNACNLLNDIKQVYGAKLNYLDFILFLANVLEKKIDNEFCEKVRYVSGRYNNLRLFIAKEMLSEKYNDKTRNVIIDDILKAENNIFSMFDNMCKSIK